MPKKKLLVKVHKKRLIFKWPSTVSKEDHRDLIEKLDAAARHGEWIKPGSVIVEEKRKFSVRIKKKPTAGELKQFKELVGRIAEIYEDEINKVLFLPDDYFAETATSEAPEEEPEEALEEEPEEEPEDPANPWYLRRGPKGGLCRLPASDGKKIGVEGVCARYKEGNPRHKAIAEFRSALQVVGDDFDLQKLFEIAEEC